MPFEPMWRLPRSRGPPTGFSATCVPLVSGDAANLLRISPAATIPANGRRKAAAGVAL